MEVHVDADPCVAAAARIAQLLDEAVRRHSEAFMAVSGGDTAPPLFAALVTHDLPWERISVWQVDERVAPDGHPDRNAEQLAVIPGHVHLMPVTEPDLAVAAGWYAARLPERFDVVHLGVGGDGHTASWPPDQPAVADSPDPVAVADTFNGYRRMTLTPPVVSAARARVVLVTGATKRGVIERWLAGDDSLPVSRVPRDGTWLYLDAEAAPAGLVAGARNGDHGATSSEAD